MEKIQTPLQEIGGVCDYVVATNETAVAKRTCPLYYHLVQRGYRVPSGRSCVAVAKELQPRLVDDSG